MTTASRFRLGMGSFQGCSDFTLPLIYTFKLLYFQAYQRHILSVSTTPLRELFPDDEVAANMHKKEKLIECDQLQIQCVRIKYKTLLKIIIIIFITLFRITIMNKFTMKPKFANKYTEYTYKFLVKLHIYINCTLIYIKYVDSQHFKSDTFRSVCPYSYSSSFSSIPHFQYIQLSYNSKNIYNSPQLHFPAHPPTFTILIILT